MTDFASIDFYTDATIVDDPHPYFDWLRSNGPVFRTGARDVVAVTGYAETIKVMLDTTHFSALNAIVGALGTLPFTVESDDIRGDIEAHRADIPFADQIISQDGEAHRKLRNLLIPLFTPARMKAKEARFRAIADTLIDAFPAEDSVEMVDHFAQPFVTLIIAELLGIPEEDRARFRAYMDQAVVANVGASTEDNVDDHLAKMGADLARYLSDRRDSPQDDVISELATGRYPDGSLPNLATLTSLAAFLFAAGQDSTARVMTNGLALLARDRELQAALRADHALIPDFIEEMLRFDGSVKSSSRLCIASTEIAGVPVKAGDTVMLALLAANHDPAKYDDPHAFDMHRERLIDHVAFGRGAHTCLGAPLARMELRIAFEQLLSRLGPFAMDERWHGPEGKERVSYIPSFLLRGVKKLSLTFEGR